MTPPSFRLLADVDAAMLAQEKRNACAKSDKALTCCFMVCWTIERDAFVRGCDTNVDMLRAGFAKAARDEFTSVDVNTRELSSGRTRRGEST